MTARCLRDRSAGPVPETESVMHPFGSYRRRIRLVNTEPGLVDGGLEDDFHYFRIRVRHDGIRRHRHRDRGVPVAVDHVPRRRR